MGSRGVGLTYDHAGARRRACYLVRHAAEQQALKLAEAAAAHDDHVNISLLGHFSDLTSRIAFDNQRLDGG